MTGKRRPSLNITPGSEGHTVRPSHLEPSQRDSDARAVMTEVWYEQWRHWPVNWSAIWVGALAAIAAVLIFGLIGISVGAHRLGNEDRIVDLRKTSLLTIALSIFASFLAFVIGGWVAGKIAGIYRAEPAMIHGVIAWLVAVPVLVGLAAIGAGSTMGGWYSGLASSPTASAAMPFDRPEALAPNATAEEQAQYRSDVAAYKQKVAQWKQDTPKVVRNTALGAVSALLLGLIGSVIGGWMSSGEPMNFTHHRTRTLTGRSSRGETIRVEDREPIVTSGRVP